jgi:4-hydroxybenzoate polyprenyltransferase
MGSLYPYFLLLRPQQWLKNLMLFFPLVLSGKLFEVSSPSILFLPFICFSLFSSCCYILNDIFDIESDRAHPKKRFRPLPAGEITVGKALLVAGLTGGLALALCYAFVPQLIVWLLGYFTLSVAYTLMLKHVAWVDLLMISLFFLLRLQAGGVAYQIDITLWLYLSVFLLSLFLSAGKRLSEVTQLGSAAVTHRQVHDHYTPGQLRGVLNVAGGTALATYAMYCVTHQALLYSVPLCAYGLYRYITRVKQGHDGDPTTSLVKDPQLLVVGVIWCVMVACALY